MSKKIKVLFVCLGNICRSPMAENLFRQMVSEKGLGDKIEVDSAGTAGYHVGDRPHPGTQAILAEYGVTCTGRSRQISEADLTMEHCWVIGMDESNMKDLEQIRGSHPNRYLLLEFAKPSPASLDVPDPYYTGDFDAVYQLVKAGCAGLLEQIIKQEVLI